jgi:hypothetical protein
MPTDYHSLPSPRSTLRAGYLDVLVWCKACHRLTPADLQMLIDTGRAIRHSPKGRYPPSEVALGATEHSRPLWSSVTCTSAVRYAPNRQQRSPLAITHLKVAVQQPLLAGGTGALLLHNRDGIACSWRTSSMPCCRQREYRQASAK